MITYKPEEISHRDFHQILLSVVSPRPIAFVSSMDSDGRLNLAPFSFFNAYASKPPVVAIGPAIAAASGREKDTLLNILQTGECTISTVSYSFVQQMNLTASDYPKGVDEFTKSGLHPVASDLVRPPYVAESPCSMECQLIRNIELFREEGGNGNIMLLKVLRIHAREEAHTDGRLDPRRMDLVGRMGYTWYTHVKAEDCFQTAQPKVHCMGMDALPNAIRTSTVLNGNQLARLASLAAIPELKADFTPGALVDSMKFDVIGNGDAQSLFESLVSSGTTDPAVVHRCAGLLLDDNRIEEAWQLLQYFA